MIASILISSFFLIGLCCGCAQSIHTSYSPEAKYASVQSGSIFPASQLTVNHNRSIRKADPVNLTGSDVSNDKSGVNIASLPPTHANPPDAKSAQETLEPEEVQSPSQKIQLLLDEALDFCQASQDFWQKGELENAIEALDHAYSLILKADVEDMPAVFLQQKEDLRFTISKRILEIYAFRNIVVNGSHDAIPLAMNRHIRSEIHLFTKGREKAFFRDSYRRSGRYRPKIVSALEEAGLPAELSWLPLIESGFKVNALSPARALGLWQFIPSTGHKFGLKRDHYVDERLDPVKSTTDAVAYLKELHQIFGDWTTVLAAYNWGEDRVLKVIRSQKVNYLDNFWDLYKRIPRETARYVPRFLATLHILKHPKKYGIHTIKVDKPLEYETVSIARVHLRDVARMIGASEKTMKDINPELRYKMVPHRRYSLKAPVGKKSMLIANLELKIPKKITVAYKTQKYKLPKKAPALIRHVVKRGDSLWIIAKRYGTTNKFRKITAYTAHDSTLSRFL